ncbi:MAG TPA: hypothetical protein VE754_05815 [Actinomycetota bacterium]|jgi:hypothetical protein|nr:hypothetical protein [Actinomycetota bacterium]
MPKLDRIKDEELKARLTQANEQLRSGQATDAVRGLADTFLWMLRTKPELLDESVPLRAGRRMPLVMRWPALGANLSLESVRAREPRIEFVRDHFALSEAITYFEFTVDTAVAQGM